ncbi:beta-defensin 119 isoform X1 [Ochotona princeps]|uniref:beta-defensin 119 isoform X1 n=1 Tax=Ochotona princeps TaxID=9978 RepID=UPI00017761A2|nr:beta-defensin 119 isoform X1 [Ochotona princeps]
MKLFFLVLLILLAKEPTISGECWAHGHCRLVCRDGEEPIVRCHNRKRCCVPSRYLTIQPVPIDGQLDWTTPQVLRTSEKVHKHKNRG